MEIIRSNKYRLYPNAKQKSLLFNLFGSTRFIYNFFLGKIQESHFGTSLNKKTELFVPKIPSEFDLSKYLTEVKQEHNFLYSVPNMFLQAESKNLYSAFKGFFAKGGYPKFKSRKQNQSLNCYQGANAKFDSKYIYLPKAHGTQFDKSDFKIKYKQHKTNYSLPEKITGYTISKDNLNQYWISFTFKVDISYSITGTGKQCGIDLGIKDLVITSDGLKIPNDNLIKKSEKKLRTLNRQLSKKKKGSKNRNKARIKVAKFHNKIKNQRSYRNHNISRELVNIYDFIGIETLKVKNMIKNRRLSKAISNVALFDLTSKIQYKMAEKQGHLIKIDTWFPSSKTCSNCGSVKAELSLGTRTYECEHCNHIECRDINAAKNILAEAKIIANI